MANGATVASTLLAHINSFLLSQSIIGIKIPQNKALGRQATAKANESEEIMSNLIESFSFAWNNITTPKSTKASAEYCNIRWKKGAGKNIGIREQPYKAAPPIKKEK